MHTATEYRDLPLNLLTESTTKPGAASVISRKQRPPHYWVA